MAGRVMVLGFDALILPVVKDLADRGLIPHFRFFLEHGAIGEALSVVPPYTPTNWATIASGALPGRHGAGNWDDAAVDDPIGRRRRSTFDARTLAGDTLWAAASRAGLGSVLLT